MAINLPSSKPQANLATYLEEFRRLHLQQALSNAIAASSMQTLNEELNRFVPEKTLRSLASRGIRGEFLFAIPTLLETKPNLLGYYRLLLGYSQKEFYTKAGLGRFKSMEDGRLPPAVRSEIPSLCAALIERASELVREIGWDKLTLELLDDLSLLTLGPQLRGSNNTRIGEKANRAVFEIIQQIVNHADAKVTESRIELLNASKRNVVIAFSSDPDISIFEEIAVGKTKKVVAIEIKGGGDKSNIWNRLGEAEKSHQTAKQRGFVEFWTIYNVPKLDLAKAREKSPTTNRFFSLSELSSGIGEEFMDFRDRLVSLVGIASSC